MKKTLAYISLIAVVITIFSSCNKDLELPPVGGEKKITLLGELVAGDSFYLRAGQSVALSSNTTLRFQLLQNLTISIKDSNGNTFPLIGYTDSFAQRMYTLPFSTIQKVMPGQSYIVSAVHNSLGAATASVRIPMPVKAIITDTASVKYGQDSTLRVRIKIDDPAATSEYYVIEALKQKLDATAYFQKNGAWVKISDDRDGYETLRASGNVVTKVDTVFYKDYVRQAIYTADANTENVYEVGSFTRSKRILMKDLRINGQNYETTVFVVRTLENPFVEDSTLGKVVIRIKSVAKEYFEFLKAYETYDPSAGYNSFQQPVKIQGNVDNGMGIVGGVSQITYCYLTGNWARLLE